MFQRFSLHNIKKTQPLNVNEGGKLQATSVGTFIIKQLGREGKGNKIKIKICQELITTEILFLRITRRRFYRWPFTFWIRSMKYSWKQLFLSVSISGKILHILGSWSSLYIVSLTNSSLISFWNVLSFSMLATFENFTFLTSFYFFSIREPNINTNINSVWYKHRAEMDFCQEKSPDNFHTKWEEIKSWCSQNVNSLYSSQSSLTNPHKVLDFSYSVFFLKNLF